MEQHEIETIEPEVVEQEVVETPVEEAQPELIPDEPKPGESARETAKREFEKLANADKPKEEEVQKAEDPKKKLLEDIDPELLPPERLRAQERQLFNNLPKGLKRGMHRMIKDLEGMTTRSTQEHARETNEIRGFKEAIAPFASQWAEQKVSWTEGTLALARAQERLTNPKTSYETYVKLGVDLGHIPADQADQILQNHPQAQTAAQSYQDPNVSALQQEVLALKQEREQERIQLAAQPIIEQMRVVQQEVDPATGRYRYPELHNGEYLLSLRPRIEELRRNDPNLSYGEALREANDRHKQSIFGYSSPVAPQQVRTLASNNQQRAAQAAVTVRGRSAPTIPGQHDIQPPASALRPNDSRATALWAYEQLSKG